IWPGEGGQEPPPPLGFWSSQPCAKLELPRWPSDRWLPRTSGTSRRRRSLPGLRLTAARSRPAKLLPKCRLRYLCQEFDRPLPLSWKSRSIFGLSPYCFSFSEKELIAVPRQQQCKSGSQRTARLWISEFFG